MREIKFRAWEKNLKEIIPVYNIDFEKRVINTDIAWRTFDEVELMQYTGLKDKNDKEIYEGDIVRHATDEGIYKVIFDDGGFYVKNLFEYDFQTIDEYPLEVIGNIYENPELIN